MNVEAESVGACRVLARLVYVLCVFTVVFSLEAATVDMAQSEPIPTITIGLLETIRRLITENDADLRFATIRDGGAGQAVVETSTPLNA